MVRRPARAAVIAAHNAALPPPSTTTSKGSPKAPESMASHPNLSSAGIPTPSDREQPTRSARCLSHRDAGDPDGDAPSRTRTSALPDEPPIPIEPRPRRIWRLDQHRRLGRVGRRGFRPAAEPRRPYIQRRHQYGAERDHRRSGTIGYEWGRSLRNDASLT